MENSKKVVLSGIRATGRLHLGNYLGALVRFARMSRDSAYQCLFFVADMHTLTTLKDAEMIRVHMPAIVLDYLAAGVDPELSMIYVQSSIPQVAELAWYLSCLTPFGDLSRQPTFKDKAKNHPEDVNAGLLNYPVLMAADILGPRAELVPVGQDQRTHLELASQLARKFNNIFGEFFPIPDALSNEMVLVPGLSAADVEGKIPKMGKSDDNTINLTDSAEQTWGKIRVAPTDPKRVRRSDLGTPENCAIFRLHEQVSDKNIISWASNGCRTAGIGCLECKRALSDTVNSELAEFRERRIKLAETPDVVREVLEQGRRRAEPRFNETIAHVREKMGMWKG